MCRIFVFRQIDYCVAVYVDYSRHPVLRLNFRYPFRVHVVKMNMPVNEISRGEFFYEPVETFETDVARVFLVVDVARGSVRQENVQIFSVADFVDQQGRD